MTATPDIIPSDLALEIDANLSPDAFMAAARAFFGYVQEIAVSLSPEGEQPKWIVRVREGSTLLGVDPVPGMSLPVIQAVYNKVASGVDFLTKGNIEDSGLSEPALKHLKVLSELTERDKTNPLHCVYGSRKSQQRLCHKLQIPSVRIGEVITRTMALSKAD